MGRGIPCQGHTACPLSWHGQAHPCHSWLCGGDTGTSGTEIPGTGTPRKGTLGKGSPDQGDKAVPSCDCPSSVEVTPGLWKEKSREKGPQEEKPQEKGPRPRGQSCSCCVTWPNPPMTLLAPHWDLGNREPKPAFLPTTVQPNPTPNPPTHRNPLYSTSTEIPKCRFPLTQQQHPPKSHCSRLTTAGMCLFHKKGQKNWNYFLCESREAVLLPDLAGKGQNIFIF